MGDFEVEARRRSALIVKDIEESGRNEQPLLDLFRFHPADGDIVGQKREARWNARALEILIQEDRATLWVVDRWVKSGGPRPGGALLPPVSNVEAAAFDPDELEDGTGVVILDEDEFHARLETYDVYSVPVVRLALPNR